MDDSTVAIAVSAFRPVNFICSWVLSQENMLSVLLGSYIIAKIHCLYMPLVLFIDFT